MASLHSVSQAVPAMHAGCFLGQYKYKLGGLLCTMHNGRESRRGGGIRFQGWWAGLVAYGPKQHLVCSDPG